MALGRFVKGVSIYAGSGIALRALSLAIAPIYTRFISVEDFGAVNLAESLSAVVATLVGFALPSALNRLYFKHTDQVARDRFVASVAVGSVGLLTSSLMLCLLIGPPLFELIRRWISVPFFPLFAITLGTAMVTQHLQLWQRLHQAEDRASAFGFWSFTRGVLTSVAVLVLVIPIGAGGVGLSGGRLIGAAVTTVGVALAAAPRFRGEKSMSDLREAIRFGASLLPYQVMVMVLEISDRFVIEAYLGTERVGVYALAATLGGVMIFVNSSVVAAWHPVFYRQVETDDGRAALGRDTPRVIAGTATIAALGALVSEDFVAVVFDVRYAEAGDLVPWILGGFLLWEVFAFTNLQILERERGGVSSAIAVTSGVANVGLNLWLVPTLGIRAAAMTTFAAYGLQGLLGLIVGQRLRRIPYHYGPGFGGLAVFGLALAVTQVDLGSAAATWGAKGAVAAVALGVLAREVRRRGRG